MKYNILERYISIISYKVGLFLNEDITAHDIIANAFIKSKDKGKNIQLCVVDEIYVQKYHQRGKKQNGNLISNDYEKQCKCCGERKNQSEYRHLFSKTYKLNYLDSFCIVCRNKYQNKKKKDSYKNDKIYRNKAKERARVYQSQDHVKKRNNKRKRERAIEEEGYREKINRKQRERRLKKNQDVNSTVKL